MKTVQFPINVILDSTCILLKNIHPYLQLRVLTKYHYFLCMCYAKESNFSFKINCTQADFQRLIGNKVRTHTFIQANIPLT